MKHEPTKYKPYVIAIPSYKRPELIYKKTLATLARHLGSTPPIQIFVFLANTTELSEYQSAWPPHFQLEKSMVQFIVGEKGLKNQRNFIMDYFPERTSIVQMDDDLDEVLELMVPEKRPLGKRPNRANRLQPIQDLHLFFQSAFARCQSSATNIWGIYPVPNAYFMTPTQTTDLRFIVGPMFGVINRHNQQLKLTTDEKENVERTLKYFTLDGRVLRYNNITVATRYFKTMGGMQASQRTSARRKSAFKAAEYLHRLYPDLTQIHLDKKSGWPEIKLITPTHLVKTTTKKNKTQGTNKTIKHIKLSKSVLGTRKKTRSN